VITLKLETSLSYFHYLVYLFYMFDYIKV